MSTTVGVTEYVEVKGGYLTRAGETKPFLEITGDPLVIGRSPECSLVLDDSKVSNVHAELVATPAGVRLRDLSSRNGTFVDTTRCTDVYLLGPVTLRVGGSRFQFEPNRVRVETGVAESFGPLRFRSDIMKALFHRLQRVAQTDLSVLIQGETGTGKELVARAIHDASKRNGKPFVVVDCTHIPDTLAESELFGHERGSFTGATDKRLSPFVEAEGGTVFLDEIGELPVHLQAKLLRTLQERKIKPVGANTYRPIDVRIVAATRRDLKTEINNGNFRDDLFFRLRQVELQVPPLRERADDVQMLLEHFAKQENLLAESRRITPESLARLMKHDWPGNVRELQATVVSSLALAEPSGPIEIMLSFRAKAKVGLLCSQPVDVAREAFLKDYWTELWALCEGNVAKMHRVSGKSRPTVREACMKYGIMKPRAKDGSEDEDEDDSDEG
jgi:DNA-binding NtrC family response regulator